MQKCNTKRKEEHHLVKSFLAFRDIYRSSERDYVKVLNRLFVVQPGESDYSEFRLMATDRRFHVEMMIVRWMALTQEQRARVLASDRAAKKAAVSTERPQGRKSP